MAIDGSTSTPSDLFRVPGLSAAVGPNPLITSFPAVNSFTLASFPLPGKWTLLSADKVYGWQIQKGFGLSGATIFPHGDEIIEPKFRGEFWAAADVAVFKEIRKQILSEAVVSLPGGLSAAAMGIDHPELKALGVTAVAIHKITPLIQEEGGLWTIYIDFLQWRRPIPAPPKPTFAVPDVSPPMPTAQDAQDIETQALQAQAAALPGL